MHTCDEQRERDLRERNLRAQQARDRGLHHSQGRKGGGTEAEHAAILQDRLHSPRAHAAEYARSGGRRHRPAVHQGRPLRGADELRATEAQASAGPLLRQRTEAHADCLPRGADRRVGGRDKKPTPCPNTRKGKAKGLCFLARPLSVYRQLPRGGGQGGAGCAACRHLRCLPEGAAQAQGETVC